MRPLDLNVLSGKEDHRLLEHIDFFERERKIRGHLSWGELDTLLLCYDRLEKITTPSRSA